MSNNVHVQRSLEFEAGAQFIQNVYGNINTRRSCFVDNFDGTTALDTTHFWTVTVGGTSDAIATDATGGIPNCKFTTGTADNECSFLATPLIYDQDRNPLISTRFEIEDVSGSYAFFGFSDATTETTPGNPIDYDSGTLAATANDCIGFLIDADKESSRIYFAGRNDGGTAYAAAIAPTTAWTDGVVYDLSVRLDGSGNAWAYINGKGVAYKASAVNDVALCGIYAVGTRANDGSNIMRAYFYKSWQDYGVSVTAF